MRKSLTMFAVVACLAAALTTPVRADEAASSSAKATLTEAQQKAKSQKKAVLVMFHASWCGWCKRLEAVMGRPEFKKMFEDNYIMVNLDVMENGEKKKLENPAGLETMKELGGEKAGLPFYAFLDAKGKKLADSNVMPKGMNIGYPGSPEEISAFMDLIKKTAPRWTAADQEKLRAYLVSNAPKPDGAH